ncbi:UDP-N-acetylmuramoyl-tripeptide--D-alanyl-D-alanine ligase [Pseudonocardia spinosispora]|uniref:UDP-N-acetylmuramoyl-tripeptide--D-alanyl-D- alanine ligase n=1 Tax=Pseudonocardia spinosispora TaxID=103441 RepID=UPI0004262262|nr:UDP-N-acetylmuramoyl-tripeptide--D-alanyl-D-alanine ligase [Pseudonocardia spinosispora]
MIPITLAEVASAVGGRLHQATGEELVTGSVEFDSRALTGGGLFVAIPGERVDGHDFAAAAHAAGAVGVLAARPVDAPSVLVGEPGATPEEQADAVLAALSLLAAEVVRRLPALEIVGLTGSSGKTSTKDLVAGVLRALGPTVAPPESFNNELGHPWTVLRADRVTQHLVLELAARGRGHIAALCAVAQPRIGVVLNVGSAHLGEFGSADAVAVAKGELVEALPPAARGGVAVLNADDERVAAMASRTAARVVTFGVHSESADIRATEVELDELGRAQFRLHTPVGDTDVELQLVGAHQVSNALAAAAVGLELGAELEQLADLLSEAEPASRWRMELTERPDGVTVINDAYNANPESMRAGLEALVAITGESRRSWAVLGDMAELGDSSAAAHVEIGRLAAGLGVRQLLAVGSAGYQTGYGEESMVVPDVATALEVLRDRLMPGDVVLVKASRAVGLERVAAGLLASDAPSDASTDGDR